MADSCCYMAETNTILKAIILQSKVNTFLKKYYNSQFVACLFTYLWATLTNQIS